ncbi:ornithine--oxo-acid transaminase [Kytococcus aerolatus]|uniref:ornithine aminotransferase n=2 Tax=Kytococcus aerolatus TaxID=592308 RepID=A0A212TAY6_9MICO|nr:ornithine--oxo-acid transaminase [Kytococcus aerolatus]
MPDPGPLSYRGGMTQTVNPVTLPSDETSTDPQWYIDLEDKHAAHNYGPLPVVLAQGENATVTDVAGKTYVDALAGYSALNFGHGNERLIQVAQEQLASMTLTSRAFYSDQLGPYARDLTTLIGKDMMLPMNTGAEAVETAIKLARKWGAEVKGVENGKQEIIVMEGNFHGRTSTIVSFSTDEEARAGYGPYTAGFTIVEYGNAQAIRDAITENTVAVLLEPIQGEGGVVIPPEGFLAEVREITREQNILMMADEIQSGLGRTGTTLACHYEGVDADVYTLGKALGGGIVPVSAVLADEDVMKVFTKGTHGSTFGGNPLANAVAHEVVKMLASGEFQNAAQERGKQLAEGLEALVGEGLVAVRVRGLWAGLDIDTSLMTGREACEKLMAEGVLAKDTHGSTIRLAPPLTATEADIEEILRALRAVLGVDA